jgi:hypothetical protein
MYKNISTEQLNNFYFQGQHFFPVNTLRNVALKFAQSDLILMMEGDFIVMPGLQKIFDQKTLQQTLRNKKLVCLYVKKNPT